MMPKTDQASLPMAQAIKCMKLQAARIKALEGLLRRWQDLLEDGPPNCGDNEATEHWEKVNSALTTKGQ